MKKVFLKTYGCQMNVRDSDAVAHNLLTNGYELVDQENSADIVLLNTCSVREQAELKAIGKARNLLSGTNASKPAVGIMGCMAQNRGNQLEKEIPGLDLIIGTQKFHRIAEYLKKIDSQQNSSVASPIIDIAPEINSQNAIKEHPPKKQLNVSAFVSIMQGCNMNCSFCIVPKTRGPQRYREMTEILDEITHLRNSGVKEITLLGQIVNAYGRGVFPRLDGKSPFVQLLEKIHKIEGIERIRFTSPHPVSFGPDLIEAFRQLPKLGKYAHLPMQSGSNRILKSMNRPYTIERFMSIVRNLREACPGIRLSTDVIVGYPGESEEDFKATKNAFIEAGFEMAFIFKYSIRTGTPAESLLDQIPQEVKEDRNQILLELLEKQSQESNNSLLGQKVRVLVESIAKKGNGDLMGKTECFRKVLIKGQKGLIGQILEVEIEDADTFTLRGALQK